MPTYPHGSVQLRLGSRLEVLRHKYPVFAGVEVRVRIGFDLIRISDISLWLGSVPASLPTEPPLVVAEVISPDDRLTDMLVKLEEYRAWGVSHIWLIEPELKRAQVYTKGTLTEVQILELPQFGFAVHVWELFD